MKSKKPTTDKIGILLINLGSPDSTNPKAVRKYLSQFLTDHRVIHKQNLFWKLILNFIILRRRSKKSARLYQKIWLNNYDISPLIFYSNQQACKLQDSLGKNYLVKIAMRYGQPSITNALSEFADAKIKQLTLLPLYPQYSATTTASCFDDLSKALMKKTNIPNLKFINNFYENQLYLSAIVSKIKFFQDENDMPDKLIFSYHGLPQQYIEAGDPYYQQCLKTSELIAKQLQLNNDQYISTFQSRFGPQKWLTPYLDKTLIELAHSNNKHIQIICPGFVSDCLETLLEVAVENKKLFLTQGGKKFEYIPCLNDDESFIALLKDICS